MDPRTKKALLLLATLAVAAVATWLQWGQGGSGGSGSGSSSGTTAPSGSTAAPAPAGSSGSPGHGYQPAGPEPAQAIPGGSLEANEGPGGGHVLARHVGRTVEQLRERLRREGIREASTFPDRATAERAVAAALYDHRDAIARWLAQGARERLPLTSHSADVVGQTLRSVDGSPQPVHSVEVVLMASRRFPEGFAILTAYPKLP